MTSPLNRRTLLLGVVPAAALGLSACGSSSSQPSASASASASASTATTSASASASATASASASADSSASVSGSATADDGYVGYRLNREVPGAGTATLYTDYQCPYCAKAEPKFEEAAKKLDGIMNVTVRHMPLNMHANAVPAALAVEAATAQGKHLEMANKLFNTQNDWKNIKERDKLRTLFNDYAKELGLNVEEFDKVLLASDTVKPIQRDYDHAVKIGVKGTPTFAVNDKVVEGLDSSSSVDDLVSTFKREAGVK
ncbi:thioredoxin domain-containing protein [Rothia sp. (in: high G+C Gram-positive bacteria)]|uniref:DsbA family protein n=1 Tax=Rothia sp. (in: high G+C Gram-positive bacteria) TaxID=1885016 RepID=UPI001CAC3B98|nr:thioredoxin domain-containing protein [Rothia sp. (in: high G+C Gram-positive bacteria)]MBF1665294.1 thioredoxin domain-containing protein [Rothia sp. (in: high G+C Gram-positive bacteria)]MBF1667595.1 thioredoxin domain-containing protein [Rothia sp. (in: high G+C Gram-positive bacteria)]